MDRRYPGDMPALLERHQSTDKRQPFCTITFKGQIEIHEIPPSLKMAALTLTITTRALFGVNLGERASAIGEIINR